MCNGVIRLCINYIGESCQDYNAHHFWNDSGIGLLNMNQGAGFTVAIDLETSMPKSLMVAAKLNTRLLTGFLMKFIMGKYQEANLCATNATLEIASILSTYMQEIMRTTTKTELIEEGAKGKGSVLTFFPWLEKASAGLIVLLLQKREECSNLSTKVESGLNLNLRKLGVCLKERLAQLCAASRTWAQAATAKSGQVILSTRLVLKTGSGLPCAI